MKKALLALVFIPGLVHADMLTRCFDLHNDTTTDATVSSTPLELPSRDGGQYKAVSFTAISESSNVSGTTPTMSVKIQTCETTTAATCVDTPIVFDQCTTGSCYTTGSQRIDLSSSVNVFSAFRAVITLGGTTPVYNARIRLCYK
jgi:hypothetical protein